LKSSSYGVCILIGLKERNLFLKKKRRVIHEILIAAGIL